ncbi:MAG: ribosome biogenesis GTP-binding protein YihA/YsxC [Legionellales bacterium]|jgi:GTP-binding protein
MNILFSQAEFLKTVVRLSDLPFPEGREVAFLGRSNVGKSSTLNAIVNQKSLARTSRTPGRTQAINIFTLTPPSLKLIDLPGYGFAKAPLAVVKQWHQLIDSYLRERECLAGLMLVMDIRHPMQGMDQAMFDWLFHSDLPVHLVLNKCDKLSRMQAQQALKKLQSTLTAYPNVSLQLFSASKKTGLEELRQKVYEWLVG